MDLVYVENGRAVTDSLIVAEKFKKNHDNVMRDIKTQLAKLEEAGEGEWSLLNFEETPYQHPQNKQWYPKYDLTEDAFAIIAMGYTTAAAMKMKVKFIREFKRMKEELNKVKPSLDIKLLTPEMQMFKYLFDGVAHAQLENSEMKRQLADQTEKVNKVESTVTAIQDTMLTRDEDWRKSMNSMLNSAAFRIGGKYQDLRNESYIMLEKRGKCNLKNRLSRLQKRLLENGSTKTKINGTSRMDVIESDPKLKEIYTFIVKELSIGSLKIVGG